MIWKGVSDVKVKTKQELSRLDEDLNLFSESDWSFLDVTEGANLEYFNDVVDVDFRKRTTADYVRYTLFALAFVGLILFSGIYLYHIIMSRYVTPTETVVVDGNSEDANSTVEQIEGGKEVDSATYIAVSQVLSKYMGVLKRGDYYSQLNKYCKDTSTFYKSEKLYRSHIEHSFDTNDCYARALKCFGKYFSVSKVVKVLYKDNTYYVYARINNPTEDVLTEYYHIYANHLTQYFSTHEISESSVVQYILELARTYDMPTSPEEMCFEMVKKGNSFVLKSDEGVTSQCVDAFNCATSQVIKTLGAGKATNQYGN